MSWSWKIGTFRGIALYVHATFVLLLGWILLSHLLARHGAAVAVQGVLFIVLLFLCVVLHEFGHALTAQRFGVQTRDITLYPIGGIARLERIPREPRQELLIALAGPAVNVAIAAALYVVLWLKDGTPWMGSMHLVGGDLIANLMWVNVILAVFNLLPAFPMDGGRVLRAFLASRMEYGRATQVAATVGQGMAFLFGFVGLFYNPFLVFVAFFVYMGAAQEAATVQTELAFRGVPARAAMLTSFVTLAPTDPLSIAVRQLMAGSQHEFPVVQDGQVVSLLTRSALVAALGERGPEILVGELALPTPAAVSPGDSLEIAFQRLRETETQTLIVIEGGELVGLLTMENIAEFVMVRSALSRPHGGYDPVSAREEESAEHPVTARYPSRSASGVARRGGGGTTGRPTAPGR